MYKAPQRYLYKTIYQEEINMALVSPGVQVSITDESFFSSSGPGTVPLIMIATKQDKLTPDGSGIAPGTTSANADQLYLISSQRELLQTFGDPDFNEIGGTAQNGYPLNEYGLLAAYSYLGAANRAYVVRADLDLTELDPTSTEPSTSPENGTYWLDVANTIPGLFKYNTLSSSWVQVTDYTVVTDTDITDGSATPSSGYQDDDIIVNFKSNGQIVFLQRIASAWQTMGNVTWRGGGTARDFQWAPHAAEPTLASNPDYAGAADATLDDNCYWLKTTTPNGGLDITLSHYDSGLGQFVTDTISNVETFDVLGLVPETQRRSTNFYYGLTGISASSVSAGTVVAFVDSDGAFGNDSTGRSPSEQYVGKGIGAGPGDPPVPAGNPALADLTLLIHNGGTTTSITSTALSFPITLANTPSTFSVNGVATGDLDGTYNNVTEVVTALNGAANAAAISGQNIIVSEGTVTDTIVFTNTAGEDFAITDESAAGILASFGLSEGDFASNFERLTDVTVFSSGEFATTSALVTSLDRVTVAPTDTVADGTYWYDPSFAVDIMINAGNGDWAELSGSLYVQSSEPTTPVNGDVWVDTDVGDSYPVIRKRANGAWVLIDNTDQTSANGIVFADARADSEQLVTSLDSDAPDALLYPAGTLLWNTRASGRNVKVWTENAVTNDYTNSGSTLRAWGTDRWVSASGNATDGSLLAGAAAQKAVVVEKLAEVLVGNEEIRDDTIFYNLIAAPGFPELIDEMVTLNVDRKEQAFIIGDSPFNLSNSTTDLQGWSSNILGAAGNGDSGLVTADTYLGVYYPSGLSTNVDGNEVVVPASHMVLRVMAQNDQTAYPWYAPAGFTRGTVTNATSVGYLNDSDEFVPVSLTQGQRDTLQQNNVNPIANIPNRGLVVFGQKTRQATASALDRVNVARLVNYIRYQADQLAQPFLFEPNDSVTRGIVKDAFDSFLAELVTLRGLNDFLVVVDESNNTPARIDNNELWIDIAIQPIKSVEFIFIPIRIRNTGDDLNL
jgi:hypothetical protein